MVTKKKISPGHILTTLYIKSVLWRVAKCLSYKQDARSLKVKGPYINKFDCYPYIGVILTLGRP